MDVIANKVKSATSTIATNQAGAGNSGTNMSVLGNFSATFTEFLSKASSGVLSGQNGKNDQRLSGSVATPTERPEPAPEPQAKAPTEDDHPHEQASANAGDEDGAHEDALPARDDTQAPRHADADDDAPEAPVAKADNGSDDRPTNDDHDGAEPVETASDDSNADDMSSDTQTAGDGDNETGAGAPSDVTSEATATTGTPHAAEVLAGLLNTAEGATNGIAAGQQANGAATNETAQAAAGETGRSNAAKGLNTAINNVTKANTANVANTAADDGADVSGQSTQSQTTTTTAARTAATATGPAQTANQQAQTAAANTPVATEAAKQANDLGNRIGQGERMNVQVNVTKESDTLVSQPTQTRVVVETTGEQTNTKPLTPTQATTNQPQTQTPQAALAQAATPEAQTSAQNQIQGRQGELLAQARAATATAQATLSAQGRAAQATATNTPLGGDATQGLNAQTPAQTAAATQAAEKAAKPQFTPSRENVTNQVNVQITKAVAAGADKINIQLRPAHLGRVDVQLEMTGDGRVSAVVTADNKDTLDLLQRDSRELEKALQDAGLQADSQSMSFNLRGENAPNDGDGSSEKGSDLAEDDDSETTEAALAAAIEGGIFADGRVDIRA